MDWATRCWCESRLHEQNSFVTLTYENEPDNAEDAVEHSKNFVKALRRRLPPGSFRYFAVTERGSLHGRLHHHAIIFGRDFLDPASRRSLESAWGTQPGSGFTDIAECTSASMSYVAGYTAKKLQAASTSDGFRMRASLDPPIGYNWLLLNHDDVERVGGIVIDGILRPVPQIFFDRNKHGFATLKADRTAYAKSTFRPSTALRARQLRMEYLVRERERKKQL